MKGLSIVFVILSIFCSSIAAQRNWAAISCFKMKPIEAVNRIFVDSLHNEIILHCGYGTKICTTTYKGFFAFNGSGFHDLDFGVETHNPNPFTYDIPMKGCITFGNKTLFGGGFLTIGSNTLQAKSLALWNGAVWDTFPKHVFRNDLNPYSGGGFSGFLKHNGKLWMYGRMDTIGNVITNNIVTFDGNNFAVVPAIPVNNPSAINKMIVYKNKLIALGTFYNSPSNNYDKLAQFDGNNWSPMGSGVKGNLTFPWELEVFNDTLYVAGDFAQADGNAGNMIMKWDGNQFLDAGFGGWCDYGPIYRLIPFKNRLYAFGAFTCAANQKAFGVAYYENGAWTVPQDSIQYSGITSAVLYNDAIYIGGGFKSIYGDTSIQKFAKLICPDFDAANGCISGLEESIEKLDVQVFPNPYKDKLYLKFEQNAVLDNVSISNTLGQEIYRLLKPLPNQEIDLSHIPSGIYFLKAENTQGQVVFKVVKE